MTNHYQALDNELAGAAALHPASAESVKLAYLEGKIDSDAAVYRLERKGATGLLYAGHLLIDASCKVPPREASEFLERSEEDLTMAIEMQQFNKYRSMDDIIARSVFLLTHLPLYRLLVLNDQLPTTEQSMTIYEKTVDLAGHLLETRDRGKGYGKDAGLRMTGALAEIVTDNLLMRGAITRIGTNIWFPYPSLFDQDHLNRSHDKVNRAWDLSVLTDTDSLWHPTYKVQVKSTPQACTTRPETSDDITYVRVNPDLCLFDGEKAVLSHIVLESVSELEEGHDEGSSENLDARLDKLLDILG